MTFKLVVGPRTWSSTTDEEGYVTYTVVNLVVTDDAHDGPELARQTPGLYIPGSLYQIGNDSNFWAWCRWNDEVTPLTKNEPTVQYEVKQYFSNKPLPPNKQRCQDFKIEDPLLLPPRISGGGTRYSEEATKDRFGNPLVNSAWEMMRGPPVEFDANRTNIKISMNVLTYAQCALARAMVDHVNSAPLWGQPPRCVKLSAAPFQRIYQGGCSIYFTLDLEFDVNPKTFDRDVPDEATKVLFGHWGKPTINPGEKAFQWYLDPIDNTGRMPNPQNPNHFTKLLDPQTDNPIRGLLDGLGKPAVFLDPTAIGTCDSCPDGAPTNWELLGMDTWVAVNPAANPPQKNPQVVYAGACDWFGAGVVPPAFQRAGDTVLLQLSPVAGIFVVANGVTLVNPWMFQLASGDGTEKGQWFLGGTGNAGGTFDCKGKNVMQSLTKWARDADNPNVQGGAPLAGDINANEGLPETITVQPYLGTGPGYRHIEHYDEAYFPLLGIPLNFSV